MKQFHYIYIVTNLINGKQYVGSHSTNNLNDNYLGSGKLIDNAKRKYGKKNFQKEILIHFNNRNDAFISEMKYINEYKTLSPNGYNISPTGGTKLNGEHSKETKEKISKSHIGIGKGKLLSEEHKRKLSENKKGKSFSEEHKRKLSESQKGKHSGNLYWKGIHRSEETKKKISESHKGLLISKETREKLSQSLKGNKNLLGYKHSEETKRKISESLKQRKLKII